MYSEASQDLLVELDRDGCVAYLDAEGQRLLQCSESDVVGQEWFRLFTPPAAQAEAREAFAAFLKSDSDTPRAVDDQIVVCGKVRRVLWHSVLLRDDDDGVMGVRLSGALVDGHDPDLDGPLLRDALKRLQELRFALDQASILAITDRSGVIVHVNDTFCQVSGYRRGELIGQTHAVVNSGHHPAGFFKEMWATIGRGKVWKGDICNRAKDGHRYWVATTIVPFVDRRGRPYQYLAIRTDITGQKSVEARLAKTVAELEQANDRIVREHARMLQAEKLSSVGMLAAGVAHEINNPLAGVKACVNALRSGRVTAERREMYYDTVVDGLERMQGIVTALLNFARPVTPSQAAVNLPDIVASCMLLASPHAHKQRVQFDHEVPEPPPRAQGDRSQLMQAVMNVLINAIHASPEGGEVHVRYAETDDRVRLCIKDQGAGIPKALIDRVCDPFFSTKPEGQGTGLGLSVTLGIIQAHGGDLNISSEPGEGTEVCFDLPAWQD
ncbi:MAG: PAS domain S-box protein [Myxococcales bacterium]|nr:PAS domain S-box protein [Myxococcales bacterium]